MQNPSAHFTPATWALVRWLTDPRKNIPADIQARLISGFFISVYPLLFGSAVFIMISSVAFLLHPTGSFGALLTCDLMLIIVRIALLNVSNRNAKLGRRTPTDLFFISSLAWPGLVGIGTAMCLASGDEVLQFLAPTAMMGIIGGIGTRNHGAPRFAIVQIILCDLPLQLVLPFLGKPLMLISAVQCPLFIISMVSTVHRLNQNYLAVAMAERESNERATHDALTGLWNRAGLVQALAQQLSPPLIDDGGLALLYLDLDGFKVVNDRYGHGAGDDILKQTAARFVAILPDTTLVSRLGGDEFVILAPGCNSSAALAIGEAVIAATNRPYDLGFGIEVSIGVSIGIACAIHAATPDTLLAEADAALYTAKANGKNCCVVAVARGVASAQSNRLAA